jgi:hypothetical protein
LSLPPLADVGFGRGRGRVSAVSPVCHGGEGNLVEVIEHECGNLILTPRELHPSLDDACLERDEIPQHRLDFSHGT